MRLCRVRPHCWLHAAIPPLSFALALALAVGDNIVIPTTLPVDPVAASEKVGESRGANWANMLSPHRFHLVVARS